METPESLTIDYVDSHARLRGDEVELVLCGLEGAADATTLVLSGGGPTVTARTEAGTGLVRARTPRAGLVDGQWSIALDGVQVDARLLVQGARPLVLLLGVEGPPSVVPKARPVVPTPSLTRRVVRRLRRVVRR
ncbi:hypothetical protein [Marmoricola sp. URHB0036]|uniref:hypothetical protein n=1 Tax=Marmoricola sp. URHB0036 TaxID=1298863 RepID=UPI000403C69A|nr:hypothetical protein [Marmoricola sp. URHB0036]